MRSFDLCLPTLHWHVFRHFPEAQFFVSTVKDANWQKAELLAKKYPNQKVHIEAVESQPNFDSQLPPWQGPGKFYGHEPYAISVSPQAILAQLWQLEQGWKLFQSAGDFAEVFIRCRPDLWFHSCEIPSNILDTECYSPWFGRFGGVCDRFAIMGRMAAQYYFQTFSASQSLLDQGCPLHPESLVKASMDNPACQSLSALRCEFSTLREDGTMRKPEIWPQDIAHCALNR